MNTNPEQAFLDHIYKHAESDGRRYMLDNLNARHPEPENMYLYKGYAAPPNGWRVSQKQMEQLDDEGRLYFPNNRASPIRLKRFQDEHGQWRLPTTRIPITRKVRNDDVNT